MRMETFGPIDFTGFSLESFTVINAPSDDPSNLNLVITFS